MSTQFEPRACGRGAVKNWLRDGFKLWLRSFGSLLPLAVLWFALVGILAYFSSSALVLLFCALLLPIGTAAGHLCIEGITVLGEGRTGLLAVLGRMRDSVHGSSKVWLRSVLLASSVMLLILVVLLAVVMLSTSAPAHSPSSLSPELSRFSVASFFLSFAGIVVGLVPTEVSIILWLCVRGVPKPVAKKLKERGVYLNFGSILSLGAVGFLFCWVPASSVYTAWLFPFLFTYYSATVWCAIQDIFMGGYKIHKMVRVEATKTVSTDLLPAPAQG